MRKLLKKKKRPMRGQRGRRKTTEVSYPEANGRVNLWKESKDTMKQRQKVKCSLKSDPGFNKRKSLMLLGGTILVKYPA